MARNQLIILSSKTDTLWRNYLPCTSRNNASSKTFIVDAKILNRTRQYPHIYNLIGWRRWLKENRITDLHFYQPDATFFPLLAGLRSLPLDITVHLTGSMEGKMLRTLSWLAPRSSHFRCAGKFIAEQLKQTRIQTNRISVDIPIPKIESVSPSVCDVIRHQIQSDCDTDSDSVLLLALAEPDNVRALYSTCWAAAILYHLSPNIRLMIAGPCTGTDARRIENWQRMWEVEGMFYLDRGRNNWDQLAAVSDMVLVGDENLEEVVRLLHVRAAGKKFAAQSGDSNEFLVGTEQATIVSTSDARSFAKSILSALEDSVSILA